MGLRTNLSTLNWRIRPLSYLTCLVKLFSDITYIAILICSGGNGKVAHAIEADGVLLLVQVHGHPASAGRVQKRGSA
jgi:hypothetical protein